MVQAINRKYKIGMSCSERLYIYMYKHFQLIIDMKSDVYNFIEKICNVDIYVDRYIYVKWMIVHKKVGLQGGCYGMLCVDAYMVYTEESGQRPD